MNSYFRGRNSGASGDSDFVRMLDSVAVVCQATQGSISLIEATRRMADIFHADSIAICRVSMRGSNAFAKVLSAQTNKRSAEDIGAIQESFSQAICGPDFRHAKVGSVWFGTEENLEGHPSLIRTYRERKLSESATILLDKRDGHGDFLELHFAYPIAFRLVTNFEALGPILADCWKSRAMGRFSDALLSQGRKPVSEPALQSVLSMDNPCRLSRAEYRVCLLLGRGLNNKAVLSELSITTATLRSHLRSIYAKTGTSSQPELIHMLLRPGVNDSLYTGSTDVA